MEKIRDFVDQRQKSWCIYCGRYISQLKKSLDHVPTKALLTKPFPKDIPTVKVCAGCNEGYSKDEEYLIAFLGAVLSGSTDPNKQKNERARGILKSNSKLRALIEDARDSYTTIGGKEKILWIPDMARINPIVLKNARGHAYFEFGEPMLAEAESTFVAPWEFLSAEQIHTFEEIDIGAGWAEVGSRMITRMAGGHDMRDGWITVQEGVYRYAVIQSDGIIVRSVLHEYLVTEVAWS